MNRRKVALIRAEARERKALLGDFILEDVHERRCDRHTFTIFVGSDPNCTENEDGSQSGVEHHMADRLEMNLSILSGISKTRPILINLSSAGGDWEDGMKMFSAIVTCPNPVTVLGTKDCRSMTSLIPLAADRFMMRPLSNYMIHYGTYATDGLQQEADTNDVERRKSNELMKRLYIARLREQGSFCDWSEHRIRRMLEENFLKHVDVWLSADEATRQGFADGVYIGDHATLRATKKNTERRTTMIEVLRKPIKVDIKVS